MTHQCLLFWHLPVDLRLAYQLSRKYPHSSIVPLSYTAAVAARCLWADQSHLIRDIHLDAATGADSISGTNQAVEVFFDRVALAGYTDIAAIDASAVYEAVFYIDYFRCLAQKLMQRQPATSFIHYPFIANSCVPGSILKVQRLLDWICDEANGFQGLGRRDRLEWQKGRWAHRAGIHALAKSIGISGSSSSTNAIQDVDVLILALEESDRRSQAPLVRRLLERGVALKWCCVEGNRMAVSEDEAALEPAAIHPDCIHPLPQDIATGYRWRSSLAEKLYVSAIRAQCHDALLHIERADWSPLLRWRVAGLLAQGAGKRALVQSAINRVLDCYRPKVVVISAAYGVNSVMQSVIRERGLPLIRLPHGVENVLVWGPKWTGQTVGRFGQLEVDLLKERHPDDAERFHAIGSFHLGEQALRDQAGYKNSWPAGPTRILFLVSWGLLFFPDTQLEIEADLLAMGDAAKAVDAELTVRCHPRQRNWDYFDYVLMQQHHGERAHWTLSDGSTSLVQAMQASHMMILRNWSGSALQAMYANRPLIAWMPRPGREFPDGILSRLPCRARTGAELEALLRRLTEEPDYRAEVVKQQHALLEQLVENPYGDPYAGAEKLVLETLERVKSEG